MMRDMFAAVTGAWLLSVSVCSWHDANAQGRPSSGPPLSGPYVRSPVDVPSPTTVPGIKPPAVISPPAPTIAAPNGSTGYALPTPPPPAGECRAAPGVVSGQKPLPPC